MSQMGNSEGDDIRAQKRLGKVDVRSEGQKETPGENFSASDASSHIEDKTVLTASPVVEHELENDQVARRYVGMILLDRYELIEFIGKGGMSMVFKARHVLTQRIIACKIMHQVLAGNAQSIIRFQQEATSASRIHHPNVIGVHDLGETSDGLPFLIMDFLEGESLSKSLQTSGTLSIERFLNIFIQATSALAVAHEKGVVHRDLKPGNIMLARQSDGSDFVTIVDFGIAKVLRDDEESFKLTRPGDIFGSPLYMSPEQCSGVTPDNRADIYSLGCVMYECLCGRPPFQGGNILETMQKHMFSQPPETIHISAAPRIAKGLSHAVLKCLRKEPNARYQKVDELQSELKSLQAHQNQLGTYGKLVAPLAMILAAVIAAASIFLWPAYGPMPDPAQWERDLKYEWPGGSVFSSMLNRDATMPKSYIAYDWYCRKDTGPPDDPKVRLQKAQRIAKFYQEVGKFDAAIANYYGAIHVMADPRLRLLNTIEEADTCLSLAECLLESEKFSDAETQVKRALSIRADLGYGSEDDQGIRAAYILGHSCKEQGPSRYEEAKSAFKPLLDITRTTQGELPGGNVARVALQLCDAADVYSLTHEYAKANDLYVRALAMFDHPALKGKNHYNIAVIRNQLGMVKMQQGEYALAQYNFEKSIEELQQIRDLSSVSIAKVRFNLSDALSKQGKWWDSLETKARARQVWRASDKHEEPGPPAQPSTPSQAGSKPTPTPRPSAQPSSPLQPSSQ